MQSCFNCTNFQTETRKLRFVERPSTVYIEGHFESEAKVGTNVCATSKRNHDKRVTTFFSFNSLIWLQTRTTTSRHIQWQTSQRHDNQIATRLSIQYLSQTTDLSNSELYRLVTPTHVQYSTCSKRSYVNGDPIRRSIAISFRFGWSDDLEHDLKCRKIDFEIRDIITLRPRGPHSTSVTLQYVHCINDICKLHVKQEDHSSLH